MPPAYHPSSPYPPLSTFLTTFLEDGNPHLITTPSLALIIDKPLPGRLNMERDERLFAYLEQTLTPAPPVLSPLPSPDLRPPSSDSPDDTPPLALVRIYQWQTPTITLGRNQPPNEALFEPQALSHPQLPLIRRVTGGRAVLHAQELTYAVSASIRHPILGGGIKASYTAIATILTNFIKTVTTSGTLATHFVSPKALRSQASASCYDSLGWAEITIDGHKLIGSAQRRGKYAFLEHGSVPIYPHKPPLEHWLKPSVRPRRPVKYTPLAQYVDNPPSLYTLSHTLGRCFLEALG